MPLNDGYAYREQLGVRAAGLRLIEYLSREYAHSTREAWSVRLSRGELTLDGRVANGEERLRPGQALVWQRPPWEEPAVPLHYALIHQDEAVVAVNKPRGLPTMHGGGFLQHTLLHLVRQRFAQAVALHRLGRATSGLVLFALTPEAASRLSRGWREHAVHKRYRALAAGVAAHDEYEISTPIGPEPHPRLGRVYAASAHGRTARSSARVLERRETSSLFEVDIHTGRPHQIRIHLASVGHPLLGDPLYAAGGVPRPQPGLPGDGGYFLHAERLVFEHPVSGERCELRAPAPPELRRAGE